ncbi:MAG TPA: SPFH domain-containing protein [Terriglobales bacterium]|nr:SPFH domain-containing protein [Terriglobales bacterium]
MLLIKYLLMAVGIAMFGSAAAVLGYDLYLMAMARRILAQLQPGQTAPEERELRWRVGVALVVLAWAPILIAMSLVVVPAGMGGVRVSQVSGTLAGTLYPGAHVVRPLIDKVVLFDTRDQLFTTGDMEDHAIAAKPAAAVGAPELMKVQAKEGLTLGLAITVRYRLDSNRLDYILNNLPQPVEKGLVPPVVASTWRELVPNYTVREVFASKREEVRRRAAEAITRKLETDGIVVKEVMLRDIQLPPEYAKGLEDLLLKEQQNDRMGVETEIQQKQVRIAELEAEATKAQQVKQAEGQAQVRVLQAKGEADAMKYLLPLKKQQIEQTRLESQARKEATVQSAEANAQAKVIDSKAEMERRKLLAEAEADRIRVTAAADTQRMQSEGAVLKQNPLLINKIIAEKLSDKLQIMVVPADGKFMFANDLLRGLSMGSHAGPAPADDPPNQ